MNRTLLLILTTLFALLTAVAVWQHGYWAIIEQNFKSLAAGQVFADLAIALLLILIWMWRDAKASGRNIWPWVVVTLFLGSFGPLIYLLTRRAEK